MQVTAIIESQLPSPAPVHAGCKPECVTRAATLRNSRAWSMSRRNSCFSLFRSASLTASHAPRASRARQQDDAERNASNLAIRTTKFIGASARVWVAATCGNGRQG